MSDINDGEEILMEILGGAIDELMDHAGNRWQVTAAVPTPEKPEEKKTEASHSQWAIGSNGKFIPVGSTVPILPPGVYNTFFENGAYGVEQVNIASDGIYNLPDMATEQVLTEIQKFWASEPKYRKHNLLYKRGLLLWGPPGGGKTVTVKLLMNELVKQGGIVIVINSIGIALLVLKALRRIEPNRNLITVFEDIDEIINYQGESSVLSMLDGEHNIDNILQLATTNYPEKLGARIINRPSRFDRRVYVGMPEEAARRVYLEKATQNGLTEEQLKLWVEDTKGLSIAHLRELVASVYCLDQDYLDVIDRLKKMGVPVKGESGFTQGSMGFAANLESLAPAKGLR